ncbi:MAG: hypothetical protein GC168_13175 [Candidatus Hydrogenedens sp.]|nr:hypothetical protein [Candidatus Hydrogenedens sp.]
MGLGALPSIAPEIRKRAYLSVLRRNWHLLPYPQLMELLDMTEEQLAFTLREDDFLYIKLGSLKPDCPPLRYTEPDEAVLQRERAMAAEMQAAFPEGPATLQEPLFQFVADLSAPLESPPPARESRFAPRYCSSYFALFGDPLLEEDIDPFPDGLLDRLKASGVDGVWMHAVLYQLAPFPWAPELSLEYERRIARLRALTERAREHGIGIYLYMNEPRAQPLGFFDAHPDLRGVTEGDHATLCTSHPDVRAYLTDSIESICRAVPDLKGFFTITASENLTSCWSHYQGAQCPRCKDRTPDDAVAGVNADIWAGIQRAGSKAELIAWDWGWRDDWAVAAIERLPEGVGFMSVSEWSIPIERGGVKAVVGEYSISAIGPGPRAQKHWAAAQARGLKTLAKIQAGNTWELAAVPYIPAVANVAQHAANLRESGVEGIMLGWSLGGYPSPNLQVVAEIAAPAAGGAPLSPEEALRRVAAERYGESHAEAVVAAWQTCSEAFREFPYDGSVVYNAPLQAGPSNLLWGTPTGYTATMVGLPYDDLDRWRGPYPPEVFASQLEKVADGFDAALATLHGTLEGEPDDALAGELRVMEAAALHFRSVSQQSRFVILRRQLDDAQADRAATINALEAVVRAEREVAIKLHTLQTRDSRIGFESSNQYFYLPADLAEKVLNCDALLAEWIPALREGGTP